MVASLVGSCQVSVELAEAFLYKWCQVTGVRGLAPYFARYCCNTSFQAVVSSQERLKLAFARVLGCIGSHALASIP